MDEVTYIDLFTFVAGIFLFLLITAIAIYVYVSLATMALARKTGTKRSWLAWIPIANFYLYSKMAGMHWWPIFLLVGMFIPYLDFFALLAFTVFNFVWFWKILDKVGKPGWWVLFNIIPGFGWLIFLIFLGVAAWSDTGYVEPIKTPAEVTSKTAPSKQQPRQKPKAPKTMTSSRLDRVKKLKGSLK